MNSTLFAFIEDKIPDVLVFEAVFDFGYVNVSTVSELLKRIFNRTLENQSVIFKHL